MSKFSLLPRRWRTKKEAAAHAEAIAGILDTPPIVPKQDGLVLFSMIGTAVLLPYLVAVKSLWGELGRGRIAILDDGTLTAQDRAILAHHCGDPELFAIDRVDTGGFPKGGCWERFLTILDHRGGEYWVQLDSDTVTLGPVPEVAQAIATNRSFTLLGGGDAEGDPGRKANAEVGQREPCLLRQQRGVVQQRRPHAGGAGQDEMRHPCQPDNGLPQGQGKGEGGQAGQKARHAGTCISRA